ncbi:MULTISPECIES: two-component system regulatory protein YycI [Peptoniphilus]|uniref:two-component system regulatory protein YycI n=1 Tax=Peptoniphilus TaxID=162289 RepID=UPI0001DA99A0|nr:MULTISPECIES: two-component system regulatory protein YycI [Peptoniphilus]EFI41722.1 YycH protein [Peptoniphilus sp. oral taxon 386 str. F0131]
MDWSKAKNILIVALLIVNLVLFGYIFSNYYKTQDKSTSNSFINETLRLLEKKDITVDCYIPKNKIKLPSLRVEFESYSNPDLNEKFFKGKGIIETPSINFSRISNDSEMLSILNSRRLIYENSYPIQSTDDVDFREAQEIIKNFLIEHGFDISDMKCVYTKKENGKYYLNYAKLYHGVTVERSYLNFILDGDVVTYMDRLWLDILDKSQSDIRLISAPKALLTLLDESEAFGRKITDIEECFYFDPEEQGYVEDITKAVQGRAIPAWKIQFDDGDDIEIGSY